MQPDFGCDIHNLIFEQIVEESIATDIENSILDAVNIWLPYINVDNIIFDFFIRLADLKKCSSIIVYIIYIVVQSHNATN